MPTTLSTRAGDTFEKIAREKYGTENDANLIAQANPGVTEPLSAGLQVVIPEQPDAPKNSPQQAESAVRDEVAVKISGKRFRFWTQISLTRSIDAFDTVSLSAPFDEKVQALRDAFKQFSYQTTDVTVGGEPLFTGTMVNPLPTIDPQKTIGASCYSLPGVLNDCMLPASAYPGQEFNGQRFDEIAKTVVGYFGIAIDVQADTGAIFKRVACPPEKKVLTFLTELAQQRNLILSSNPQGALLIQRPTGDGKPVAVLSQGVSPVLSVVPTSKPQGYYSHITGLKPVSPAGAALGRGGGQYTVKNPHLTGVIRPYTYIVSDAETADLQAAVEAKAARMFGDAASYSVGVSTWRDESGNLWSPGSSIMLIAPGVMIYKSYKFIIRSIAFERDGNRTSATLSLAMSGSFSGQIPETMPWDE